MADDGRRTVELDPAAEARRRKAALRTALVLAVLILAIGAAAFWYLWDWRAARLGTEESVNVLVLGVDEDGVDAVFVTTFHPGDGAVAAVALPIDTRLPWSETPAHLRDTYDEGGDVSLRAAVERLLGVPLHHVVRVDFSGFVELVDLLQGVPVQVDTDVVYRDAEGQVVFELHPGVYRLAGEDALLYVRYKGDHLDDETRRVDRQLRFLEAVAREARGRFDWSAAQDLLRIVLDRVETDLDLVTLTRLARFALEVDEDAYAVHVLPGFATEDGWLVDENQVAALSDRLFHNPSWDAARR